MSAQGRPDRTAVKDVVVEPWEPEVVVTPSSPVTEWDGTCTRLVAGVPMIRDLRVIGEGDPFVVKACKDKLTGRWIGPEAAHVEDLFAQGNILGSQTHKERLARQAATEQARGVHQPLLTDPDGKVKQRPMTELAVRTTAQVQREWERPLSLHLTDDAARLRELRRRESLDARSGDRAGEDVADALARALAPLLSGQGNFPGAEGPGTAKVDD